MKPNLRVTRREAIAAAGKAAAVTVAAGSLLEVAFGDGIVSAQAAQAPQSTALNAIAGVDRVVMKQGRTYLNAWAGYGAPPRPGRQDRACADNGVEQSVRSRRRDIRGCEVARDDRDVLGAGQLRAADDGRQRH